MKKIILSKEEVTSKIKRIYQDFDYIKNEKLKLIECKKYGVEEILKKVEKIPGLVVLFEEIDGLQRIVFVGNSKNVRKRVQEYIYDKERNATLKRHIGYAMINSEIEKGTLPKEYAKLWWDYKNPDRENNSSYMEIEEKYCKEVLSYIKENFSFIVIPIADADERSSLAWRILATLSWDTFKSEVWLGKSSLHQEVRDSGLWAMRTYHSKAVMEDEDFINLEKCLGVLE